MFNIFSVQIFFDLHILFNYDIDIQCEKNYPSTRKSWNLGGSSEIVIGRWTNRSLEGFVRPRIDLCVPGNRRNSMPQLLSRETINLFSAEWVLSTV